MNCTTAINKDPNAMDPKCKNDREILLKTGALGLPYSKYQMAAVEDTQNALKPEKKLITLNN